MSLKYMARKFDGSSASALLDRLVIVGGADDRFELGDRVAGGTVAVGRLGSTRPLPGRCGPLFAHWRSHRLRALSWAGQQSERAPDA